MGGVAESAVRFELLGPLRAWRDDVAVDLGPVQQRVVLAVLLLAANRPVGRQQLIEAVWGDAEPGRAVNLLQRHASGLRRALEPGRSDRSAPSCLRWTDAGYELTIDPSTLDLAGFEELTGRARSARTVGRPDDAVALLRAALDLWRGPLADGLSSPLLDAERDRWQERRIRVEEARIELSLQVDGVSEVVDQLRRLVAEHPFREKLRGLLMLALYREDRTADALEAYRDARRALRSELGVDPSAALQRLHQQILARDPALSADSAARPAGGRERAAPAAMPGGSSAIATRPAPAQLPHARGDFVGREVELDQLDAMLRDGPPGSTLPITAVAGAAGLGKTTLALQWAHRVKEQFPDGQLYVDLRGFDPQAEPIAPSTAVRGFLEALGIPGDQVPVEAEAQAALYRSLLAGRRVLIVLDNAREATQVRPLLPGSPTCAVVVTSRDQLLGLVATDGARPLPLDVLDGDGAERLLAARLGQSRVEREPTAVAEIIAACGRLPLALAVVAARASANPQFPLALLAEELRSAERALDQLGTGELGTDVRAAFSWSYRALDEADARLFRELALIPVAEISTAAVASLAGQEVGTVTAELRRLTRANLVIERRPGRFALHDLLRAYGLERGLSDDSEATRAQAQRRLLDHYLHTACEADRLIAPFREDRIDVAPPSAGVTPEHFADHRRAMAWCSTEAPALQAAIGWAADNGFPVHAWQTTWTLTHVLERRGHWHESAAIHLIAVRAAEQLPDREAQATACAGAADALIRLSRFDEARAMLQRALELYRTLDHPAGMAHAHRTLTWVADRTGDYADGLLHAEQALALFERADRRSGIGRALNAVGWFHLRLGDPARALDYCRQGLAIQRQIGARFDQADTLDSVGQALHHLGRHEESIGFYAQAVELYREFGHRYNEAEELVALGEAQLALGDAAGGRESWRAAAAIFDELGSAEGIEIARRSAALDAERPAG